MIAKPIIAFGGNVGDVRGNIKKALNMIDALPETKVTAISSVYRTAPVGGPVQDDFLNGAARVETTLTPDALMTALMDIEKALGRVREIPDGPRTVDLDLILWDDQTVNTPLVTLPHPRMHQRAFVLVPVNDIAPNAVHPALGLTVAQMLQNLGPVEGVEREEKPLC